MLNQSNENLLSIRNYQDIESIISPTVEKCLNYLKNKTVIIDINGSISILLKYEDFQWLVNEQVIEFLGYPNEMSLNIELNKIVYIICETDEPCELFNSIEFWLDNDNLVKIWTEE